MIMKIHIFLRLTNENEKSTQLKRPYLHQNVHFFQHVDLGLSWFQAG